MMRRIRRWLDIRWVMKHWNFNRDAAEAFFPNHLYTPGDKTLDKQKND